MIFRYKKNNIDYFLVPKPLIIFVFVSSISFSKFSNESCSNDFSKHFYSWNIYFSKNFVAVSNTSYFNSLKFSVLGRYGPISSAKITSFGVELVKMLKHIQYE